MNGLLSIIKRDFKHHLTAPSGYGSELLFISLNDPQMTYSVRGYISNTTVHYDIGTGDYMNSGRIACTVIEESLTDVGLVTRDVRNNLILKGWKIRFVDSTGYTGTYNISEMYPDNQLGNIVFIMRK